MEQVLLWCCVTLSVFTLMGVLIVLLRPRGETAVDPQLAEQLRDLGVALGRVELSIPEQFRAGREESATAARQLRQEIAESMAKLTDANLKRMQEIATLQQNQLDVFAGQMTRLTQTLRQDADQLRADSSASGEKLRQSIAALLESLRTTIDGRLQLIQQDNAKKLDEMRQTVDEKLQGTLEKRLGESFKLVSERLEKVHQGLGEMQNLASGVGDLKKVLTNVKTRGGWGEVQLGNLLEQIMRPEQYDRNVATRPGSSERVEFAVKLPDRQGEFGKSVWLPMDAKFPMEDYHRLVDASEAGDAEAVSVAAKSLETRIKKFAGDIRDKYIEVPATTDFAIMFLPTEGLYSEVLRRPGLSEQLQRDYRVIVTGPTTLAAILTSLQVGFNTLAIQKRSSEVWDVLGKVKSEFSKFGETLASVKKKLDEASNKIDTAARHTRKIEKNLRDVHALPAPGEAQPDLLPPDPSN